MNEQAIRAHIEDLRTCSAILKVSDYRNALAGTISEIDKAIDELDSALSVSVPEQPRVCGKCRHSDGVDNSGLCLYPINDPAGCWPCSCMCEFPASVPDGGVEVRRKFTSAEAEDFICVACGKPCWAHSCDRMPLSHVCAVDGGVEAMRTAVRQDRANLLTWLTAHAAEHRTRAENMKGAARDLEFIKAEECDLIHHEVSTAPFAESLTTPVSREEK